MASTVRSRRFPELRAATLPRVAARGPGYSLRVVSVEVVVLLPARRTVMRTL